MRSYMFFENVVFFLDAKCVYILCKTLKINILEYF